MHYIKTKQDAGLIRVMTMSEYWKFLHSASEVRENEFGSGLTFSLEQNYPNPFHSFN